MRPGSNVSSETGKRSFEYSPIGFPPTVAKSTNSTHRGRSRQRARLSGTTSQAPRHCCHSPELALGRTKSPEGSAERILEAERLISIGDVILGIDSFRLGVRYTAANSGATQLGTSAAASKSQATRLIEGNVAFSAEINVATRVGSVMPQLVHGMRLL